IFQGNAGTCAGSRLKGHCRGGGLSKEHAKVCPVIMTDEYCTSKTCCFCFAPVELVPVKRLVNGVMKQVRCNGAVRCINPDCISVKAGYSVKPRDTNAAMNIALAGASQLLTSSRLPPFRRSFQPTI
ncbi:hypothetical protein B0O80DRAFT_371519, partial [Mortierella sp. GBAus27b]